MTNVLPPVVRQNLSDEIAQRIAKLVRAHEYEPGSRLPAISDMARQFGVGAPTLREAGYPDVDAVQWVGMLAPAKTPKDIIAKLNAALVKTLVRPDVISRFTAQGVTAASSSSEEFQTLIETEVKQWLEVSQKNGPPAPEK